MFLLIRREGDPAVRARSSCGRLLVSVAQDEQSPFSRGGFLYRKMCEREWAPALVCKGRFLPFLRRIHIRALFRTVKRGPKWVRVHPMVRIPRPLLFIIQEVVPRGVNGRIR